MPDDLPTLPVSPASSRGLSLEQRSESDKLLWIAGRVKTLLSSFYDPREDEALEEAVLDDWIAILEDQPRRYVQEACVAYLADPPRTKGGSPRRPIPGDILALARRFQARDLPQTHAAPTQDEPPRERVSPERATEMLLEAGFLTPTQAEERMAHIRAGRDCGSLLAFPVKRVQRSGEE
jgi:hypothetical protein